MQTPSAGPRGGQGRGAVGAHLQTCWFTLGGSSSPAYLGGDQDTRDEGTGRRTQLTRSCTASHVQGDTEHTDWVSFSTGAAGTLQVKLLATAVWFPCVVVPDSTSTVCFPCFTVCVFV